MKQLILSFALVFTMGLAQAQITVTNASFYAAGDTISLALIDSLSGVTISAAGTGQVWDFSALSPDTVLGFRVRPANQGAGSASFPTADLVLANQLGETYFRKSASAMSNLGFVGGFGIPLGQALTPTYNPPLVEQRAPMAYFDVNTANSALQVTFPASFLPDSLLAGAPIAPDSIRFSQTLTRLDVVDSWGQLKLPGGDYQVLRERRQTITDTKIEVLLGFFWIDLSTIFPFPGAGQDTSIAYHFFANGVKGPVAVFDVEPSDPSQVISVQYQDQILTSTHQPVVLARRLFRGPLPATDMLRFDLSILDRTSVVEVLNLAGQVVRRQESAPALLELGISGLPAGSYFYRVTDVSGLLESGALLLQP
jgi:hypothetical protein